MSIDKENMLWNIIYGNCGYTGKTHKEKEAAGVKLLAWYKSDEYYFKNKKKESV